MLLHFFKSGPRSRDVNRLAHDCHFTTLRTLRNENSKGEVWFLWARYGVGGEVGAGEVGVAGEGGAGQAVD